MSTSLNKATILIIDDQPGNLLLLTNILTGYGYNIRQVKSGERALKMAVLTPPDLILLDVKMPGMDGYEVCRQLKDNDDLKNIPVIFISSLDDTTDKVRAFGAGAVDYITKPLDPDEVLARVQIHLDIRLHQNHLKREIQSLRDDWLAARQKASQRHGHAIKLTDRERECLMWLARGLRNDRIAEKLGIKPATVQLHLDKARKRLAAATREQALAIAIQIEAIKP